MDIVREIGKRFWSPNVWLPPNVTWDDIAPGSRPDVHHADYRDLIWPLPLAVLVMLIRYTLERSWIAPVGKSFGIKSSRPKKASPNPVLEDAYEKSSQLGHKTVLSLMKQTDLTERQIQRWWRLRRAQDKPSTLVKFCENSWRCLYYTYSFVFGLIVLWDKPWFWDIKNCWYGYPHQSIENDIWWYYMISMSFYWSLTGTQFFDVKRKDFWQMFIHHMVTLLLMSLSWVCNLHRVGSLVLVVHDCADIFLEVTVKRIIGVSEQYQQCYPNRYTTFLEKLITQPTLLEFLNSYAAAKLTKYANFQKACDCLFAVFTVIWIITRLGFYPRIIYSSSIEAPKILPMFPAYYIFNGLLILLLILHIVWTYMILKIAVDSVKKGLMSGDIRSSSSEEISDSSESTKLLTNGTPKDKTANSASLPKSNIGDNAN